MWKLLIVVLSLYSGLLKAGPLREYFKNYQLGLTYSYSPANFEMSYDLETNSSACSGSAAKKSCPVELDISGASGLNFIFEQQYNAPKKGHFYHSLDVGFALGYFQASLSSSAEDSQESESLPLNQFDLVFGQFSLIPYYKFGLVSHSVIPDLIFTLGAQLALSYGSVTVNSAKHTGFIFTPIALGEFDAVIFRREAAYFSIYMKYQFLFGEVDLSGANNVDGMSNYKLSMDGTGENAIYSVGLKYITNFP